MNRIWRTALVIALGTAGVAGCRGGSSVPAADDKIFEGLDPEVVAEVLAFPHARQSIGEKDERAVRDGLAQGMVRNFIVCRDAHRVYTAWVNTGSPPQLAANPVPANPVEPASTGFADYYAQLSTAVKSGEIDNLRFWLTAEGGCGQWIPAEPDEPEGPTIKDVIEGRS